MLVDDKLAKEKLARLIPVDWIDSILVEKFTEVAQLIRNTDLTDCAPDQGSVRNATDMTMSQFATKEDYWTARVVAAETEMRERCAREVDALIAMARPLCEANHTDGDSWLESAAAAIRALPDQKD